MNILTQLFFAFIQVGMFSVGGGYAAIPLIPVSYTHLTLPTIA